MVFGVGEVFHGGDHVGLGVAGRMKGGRTFQEEAARRTEREWTLGDIELPY